jgi:ribosomal protein S18 acetylase RimI-like enzyme
MITVHIRRATLDDLDQLAPLFDAYRQFYDQASDLEHARTFLSARMSNKESVVLLAFNAAGKAVAFSQLYPSFCSVDAVPIFVLYDLFVAPVARRSGAGRALLTAAETLAVECGKARLDLMTARDNRQAQALYEALGWTRDEVFVGYSKSVAKPQP